LIEEIDKLSNELKSLDSENLILKQRNL